MRFLANENIPKASIQLLRTMGHDVVSVAEDFPGISDKEVLQRAVNESRTVVTFDSDYGELVFFENVLCPPSILYLRFAPIAPTEPAELIQALLGTNPNVLEGYFVVLDRSSARRRQLPTLEG